MKAYVFTMMDDVCTLNNKTEEQKREVLKVLSHYGKVENYDDVVAGERAKYQSVIDNQTKQIEAIKEQELTPDEMSMVKAYRMAIGGVVAQHKAVEAECKKTITTLEETLAQFKSRVIAALGE
jgi:uncharacterized protein YjcR